MITFDPSSKRFRLALRFFSYGAMTVVTVIGTIVLVFFAMGYRFDTNFHFAQGGLVQFNSFPSGAAVAVDGKKQGFTTPGSANLSAGGHAITLSLAGYDTWNKTISLAPGQLRWLSYVRLIPQKIVTDAGRDFDTLTSLTPSPDKHWLLLQTSPSAPVFTLVDSSDPTKLKYSELQLPDAAVVKAGGQYGTFSVVEWDLGSQYILLKQQNNGQTAFIRLDRSKPEAAINISAQFGFTISDAHFSGGNANVVFANTSGVLRRLDLGSGSASDVLASNIQQFTVLGDNEVAFIGQSSQPTLETVGIWQSSKTTTVRTVASSVPMMIAYQSYEGHNYLAIARADSNIVDILRDPDSSPSKDATAIFAQFDLRAAPRWLNFSPSGRMVFAQNNNYLAVFDLEEIQPHQALLNFGAAVTTSLRWLDDFYLWSDTGSNAHIVEFDGTNPHLLGAAQPDRGATLSSDGKYLFSIGKTVAGKYDLQSTHLTTSN
ncbi:MAG TPA: PEGA domain-containing protein [Candidatus Acidoferrum sp.]|nr:PEGA domain-containing protein [Candidatus Acidoferrum sp.]